MSVTVILVPNALEPERCETHEVPALLPWLLKRFGKWPETARLMRRAGKLEYDVTPTTEDEIQQLAELDGTFVVRIFPGSFKSFFREIGNAFSQIPSIWGADIKVPSFRSADQRARDLGGSPNNHLGKRSNQARPKQRIPYILGSVKSIPDLLTVPYTTYVDHLEYETAYYCVGVGEHDISEIRDGDTLLNTIEGASADVYMPGDAPTGGFENHEPEFSVGEPIEDDVYTVYQVESVNGQEMVGFSNLTCYGSAFTDNATESTSNLWEYIGLVPLGGGVGEGKISLPYNTDATEITDRIEVGDELFVLWPTDNLPGGVGTEPDLSTPVLTEVPVTIETLTVTSIAEADDRVEVYVQIPASQVAQWELLSTYFGTPEASFPFAQVTPVRAMYQGPFLIDFEHPAGSTDFEIVCNFIAPNGLFTDDGVTTRALHVNMQVILTPANSAGIPIGDPEVFQETLQGSATSRSLRALTMRCKPVGFGGVTRCLVQARRLTNSPRRWRQDDLVEENFYGADLDADPPVLATFSGQFTDEVRWTHCYSMSKPPNISFGNVTTIHTRTAATRGALRVKDRNLNCLAFRRIQTWDGDSFGGTAVANNLTDNLIFTILKDTTIGNLSDSRIDFEGIVAALDEVRAKVPGNGDIATRLNFTLDDSDMSFEETLQLICQAAFCEPYREAQMVKVKPEVAGDDSAVLLNHRNILPRTMRITDSLGETTENDAVEVSYVDYLDHLQKSVTVPIGGAALRPRQVKVAGLDREQQAYWHAYRALMKMRYQRATLALEAVQEAGLLLSRDRVLVADLTRSSTQDGEIIAWDEDDSILRTSQPVELEGGRAYSVYLQDADGTVGEYAVVSAPSARELEIDGSPSVITDGLEGVRTTYVLAPDDEPTPRAYLVSSVRPTTPMTLQVDAVNYSNMYYFADGLTTWVDFANGLSDHSPVRRTLVNTGGVVSGGFWTGSTGDHFDDETPEGDADHIGDLLSESYTKILFINATDVATVCGLIQTSDVAETEIFAISAGGALIAGHEGSLEVSADYTSYFGAEHMVAVTFDEPTGRMALFIDGALVGENLSVLDRSTLDEPNRYLEDYVGTCRWVARWDRALSDRAIMDTYLRMRAA